MQPGSGPFPGLASLEIVGDHGPVPNTFRGGHGDSGRLGIVFPGVGYTSRMPALRYPILALEAWGASVLTVDYDYRGPAFRAAGDEERFAWIAADARAAVDAALAAGEFRDIAIVGKSIGTIAMAAVLGDARLSQARCAWLTPLLRQEAVSRAILESGRGRRGLLVIGTEDPDFDPGMLERIRSSTSITLLPIERADHVLEVESNVSATIMAQLQISSFLEEFLRS